MGWLKKSNDMWERIEKLTPPKDESLNHEIILDSHKKREQFIAEFGFAIPSREAIAEIKEFIGNDKVLEVGSGRGTWAKLMRDAGIDVLATDIASGVKPGKEAPNITNPKNKYWGESRIEKEHPQVSRNNHADIMMMSARDAIRRFRGRNVLAMIWPPYDNKMAYTTLKYFAGNKLIYVGEGYGGCTGDMCFHKLLDSDWKRVGFVSIPQFWGLHDNLYLYMRS